MTRVLQSSINFSYLNSLHDDSSKKYNCCGLKLSQPISCYCLSATNISSFRCLKSRPGDYKERWSFLGLSRGKDDIFETEQGWKWKKRQVLVRLNQGFGFNGGGGGGGRDDNTTVRVLGNVAFAIVSLWLLAVLLPIVGLGAFIWWARRDIVRGSCPNCGNNFQIFKSFVHDDLQLCPFCSQPFSVVGNKFVRDPVKFSNEFVTFGRAYHEVSRCSKKEKGSPQAVVDVEAEIKDVD